LSALAPNRIVCFIKSAKNAPAIKRIKKRKNLKKSRKKMDNIRAKMRFKNISCLIPKSSPNKEDKGMLVIIPVAMAAALKIQRYIAKPNSSRENPIVIKAK